MKCWELKTKLEVFVSTREARRIISQPTPAIGNRLQQATELLDDEEVEDMEESRGQFDLDFADDGNRHVEEEAQEVAIRSSTRTTSISTTSRNDTFEFEEQDRIEIENEEAEYETDDCVN